MSQTYGVDRPGERVHGSGSSDTGCCSYKTQQYVFGALFFVFVGVLTVGALGLSGRLDLIKHIPFKHVPITLTAVGATLVATTFIVTLALSPPKLRPNDTPPSDRMMVEEE